MRRVGWLRQLALRFVLSKKKKKKKKRRVPVVLLWRAAAVAAECGESSVGPSTYDFASLVPFFTTRVCFALIALLCIMMRIC